MYQNLTFTKMCKPLKSVNYHLGVGVSTIKVLFCFLQHFTKPRLR